MGKYLFNSQLIINVVLGYFRIYIWCCVSVYVFICVLKVTVDCHPNPFLEHLPSVMSFSLPPEVVAPMAVLAARGSWEGKQGVMGCCGGAAATMAVVAVEAWVAGITQMNSSQPLFTPRPRQTL